MKVRDYEGVERDIYSVFVEVDRDCVFGVFFFVKGRYIDCYHRSDCCCIRTFRGMEEMDAALDLRQELFAGLEEERKSRIIPAKSREAQP